MCITRALESLIIAVAGVLFGLKKIKRILSSSTLLSGETAATNSARKEVASNVVTSSSKATCIVSTKPNQKEAMTW